MNYQTYNREERDICAHLFRLLLHDQPAWGPLKAFLGKTEVEDPRVFCEVALIRDAYHERRSDRRGLVSSICDVIARQNSVSDYTRFENLPPELRDPRKTHPKQIAFKLRNDGHIVPVADKTVYGSLQAMFNAKPDLAICEGNNLFVYEAKYTLDFDPVQLERTRQIAEVWQRLLYQDLGFDGRPDLHVKTIGLRKYSPDVSWEDVNDLAVKSWGREDFSSKVLSKVVGLS